MAFTLIEIPHGIHWRKKLSRPQPRRLSPTAIEAVRLHREMAAMHRLLGERIGLVDPLGSTAAYHKMVRAIVDDAVPLLRAARGRVGVQP